MKWVIHSNLVSRQGWFNIQRLIHRLKREHHVTIFIDAEKASDKIWHPCRIKTLRTIGMWGNIFDFMKSITKILQPSVNCWWETQIASDSVRDQGNGDSAEPWRSCHRTKARKENKRLQVVKQKHKPVPTYRLPDWLLEPSQRMN